MSVSPYIRSMETTYIRTFFTRIGYWCARAFQLQLFLTLFSLPILVAWGLPLSVASPLGNLIFNPFLTIFLLLASLMFFAQLLHIPYGPCAFLLNYLTSIWVTLMNYGSAQWLIGIVRLPLPMLCAIGCAPLCIVAYRHTRSLQRSTFCFLLIIGGICGYARLIHKPPYSSTIACGRGELTLLFTPTATILIDPGYMGSLISAASWARYTLIPHLISTTGTTHIHHVILLQPMGLGFEAAEQLCSLLCIDNLYIPYWHGSMKRSHLVRYAHLKQTAAATNTTIMRNGLTPQSISYPGDNITIRSLDKQIRLNSIQFPAQKFSAQIDNQDVTIYSAKYTESKVKKALPNNNLLTKKLCESLL